MKLWRVEHFWTYLSSHLGVIAEYNSNHAQKWRQICPKVFNVSEFHFSEVTFFQNWYFNINFVHLITKLITKICLYNFRAVSKEEYPYKIYPPYCQGALYLFDIHTSEQLCHLFEMELHRNYVWIEDVFITGYLFTYVFFLFI